ncbi:hypothetical protein CPC08DRAFT_769470 [Agrocybe pediades]|nr:hypothetical protein CPC08DRAFT_769470 [Agrocybe pediades]
MSNTVTLNEDVLWTIFTTIAEDDREEMDDRLQCVLNGTLVCQQWRQNLLSARNIWGRLVYVDSKSPYRRKCTLELLKLVTKRSGSASPLFIQATARWQTADRNVRLFLCQFMSNEWERVEEIYFNMVDQSPDKQIRDKTRAVVARPAPRLRVFHVQGDHHEDDWDFDFDSYFERFIKDNICTTNHFLPAFANSAPQLEEFLVCCVFFPLNAPWLSTLRSLVVDHYCLAQWFPRHSLSQLLRVLELMPGLESLQLHHLHLSTGYTPPKLDNHVIDMRNLTRFQINAPPNICSFLRDHIHGSQAGCVVNLNIVVDDNPRLQLPDSYLASLDDLFSETLKQNMALTSPPGQDTDYIIKMYLRCEVMEFVPKLQSAKAGTCPSIEFRYPHMPGERENRALLTVLRSVFSQFRRATTLHIAKMGMADYYVKCLLSLPSITTLEVMLSSVLYWLSFIRWDYADHAIFPHLQTLRVYVNGPGCLGDNERNLEIGRAYRSSRISTAIIAYFESRHAVESATSIKQLEINCTERGYADALIAIQETAQEVIEGLGKFDPPIHGLRVRWMKSWEGQKEEYTFEL